MTFHLPPEKNDLLLEVVRKHGLIITPVVNEEGVWQFSDTDRDVIIDAISSEFCASGLLPNSEPNQRGLLLEELLDELNKLT